MTLGSSRSLPHVHRPSTRVVATASGRARTAARHGSACRFPRTGSRSATRPRASHHPSRGWGYPRTASIRVRATCESEARAQAGGRRAAPRRHEESPASGPRRPTELARAWSAGLRLSTVLRPREQVARFRSTSRGEEYRDSAYARSRFAGTPSGRYVTARIFICSREKATTASGEYREQRGVIFCRFRRTVPMHAQGLEPLATPPG